jgi:hypothetical protein
LSTSPVTLLGARLRAGVYTLGTYIQPPLLPRVSILDDFEEVNRSVSLFVTVKIRLVRTPPLTNQCSVQWSVIGTDPTPITAGYFSPPGLPFGLGIFEAGSQYLDITLMFSPGPLPPTDLFGIFQIFGASGCTIQGTQASFQFRLLEIPPYTTPWTWDEPVWIPRVSYAAAPNKVQLTTTGDLATLNGTEAGNSYVINGTINGAGATFTIGGVGTAANPIRIIPAAAGGTLQNCILKLSGAQFVQIAGLDLQNVQIQFRGSGQMLQVEGIRCVNYTRTGVGPAIHFDGQCKVRYFRIYGNEFIGFSIKAIDTGVINPHTTTNHFKYIWFERNLFQGFTAGTGTRNFAIFAGEANQDADKNVFLTIKDNLVKDFQEQSPMEIKLGGNARIIGNTFERFDTALRPYAVKLRFGSIKTNIGTKPTGTIDTAVGALIEGNMFVTPDDSTITGDSFKIKDAGHRIVHNWGVKLAANAQPVLGSPLNGARVALSFGNMDMTWWPDNAADFPQLKGRFFINTGLNAVAGNRMTVEVGSEENPLKPGETLWPATTNTVSAASPLRIDRNAAVTIFPEPRQVDTITNVAVLGVDYNQVPVRILTTTCGRNAP